MRSHSILAMFLAACAVTLGMSAASCASVERATYWMTMDGSRWAPMPEFDTRAQCAAMDSCSGGGGLSGGGCYKWAAGPNAPGQAW